MHDPSLLAYVALCAAALLAGWVDAVAGGGGLIQLPAVLLLMPGATPVQILATNKLSSIAGTTVAAATYQRRLRPDLRTAVPMAVVALVGAGLGALAATYIPTSWFRPLVLVLLVLVGVHTAVRPQLGKEQELRFRGRAHVAVTLTAAAAIGFYDGIFGPGTGSFLVFALVVVAGYSLLQASAQARIVNVATNLGALAVFVVHGAPVYSVGIPMAVCNVIGGRLGALTAISRGAGFVRLVFLVVVSALVLRLGWDVLRS